MGFIYITGVALKHPLEPETVLQTLVQLSQYMTKTEYNDPRDLSYYYC